MFLCVKISRWQALRLKSSHWAGSPCRVHTLITVFPRLLPLCLLQPVLFPPIRETKPPLPHPNNKTPNTHTSWFVQTYSLHINPSLKTHKPFLDLSKLTQTSPHKPFLENRFSPDTLDFTVLTLNPGPLHRRVTQAVAQGLACDRGPGSEGLCASSFTPCGRHVDIFNNFISELVLCKWSLIELWHTCRNRGDAWMRGNSSVF